MQNFRALGALPPDPQPPAASPPDPHRPPAAGGSAPTSPNTAPPLRISGYAPTNGRLPFD